MLTRGTLSARDDSGFTLIEMLVSITVLGVIFSTLSLVMVGSMQVNKETRARLDATRDEQFVAAYFASDMAGATQVIAGGPSTCGTGAPVVTFVGGSFVPTTSASATPSSTTTVASYVFATGILTRQYCEGAGNPPFATPTEKVTLARQLTSAIPTVTCFGGPAAPACSNATTRVSVAFPRIDAAPFTLSGTRRASP